MDKLNKLLAKKESRTLTDILNNDEIIGFAVYNFNKKEFNKISCKHDASVILSAFLQLLKKNLLLKFNNRSYNLTPIEDNESESTKFKGRKAVSIEYNEGILFNFYEDKILGIYVKNKDKIEEIYSLIKNNRDLI